MINFIGTDITKELLIVYTLIGIVITFLIVFLIVDHVKSKKRESAFNPKKLTRSLKELEKETRKVDIKEETVLVEKQDELIVPIEDIKIEETIINEVEDEIYIEEEIEKTQAQIEVEEITKALEEAQKEERIDPYKQFEEEQELNEIVQLVGKDSLAEPDKLTLEVARMVREDFLQQNSFTPYDRVCPIWKSFWMLKNMLHYYDLSKHELFETGGDRRITYDAIANHMQKQIQKLIQMKFVDPKDGIDQCVEQYRQLYNEIDDRFRAFSD